jgi:hypothetical protein
MRGTASSPATADTRFLAAMAGVMAGLVPLAFAAALLAPAFA